MCDNEDDESEAFHVLCGVLEDALRTGADAVKLEYEGSGLEVSFMFGNTGLGSVIVDRELERGIIAALVEKAKLDRRSRGKMRINLLGERHTAVVEEYESFGESAFRLSLEKPKRKHM
jgi:hypothetical protein